MNVSIEPIKINKRPENEVTSHHIYAQKNGLNRDIKFHAQGLFSKQIFGAFGSCECGEVKGEGYCEKCNTRVVEKHNLPDYFIDLGFAIPKFKADFSSVKKVKKLLCYKAILVEKDNKKEVVELDCEKQWEALDVDGLENCKLYIGLEAASMLEPKVKEWAKVWMTDFISVPHPYFRPLIKQENGTYVLGEINALLAAILRKLQEYKDLMNCIDSQDIWHQILTVYHAQAIYESYEQFERETYRLFCKGKTSFIHQTLRGHGIVNTVRGVCVNRFDVAEDIILVGDSFIEYLYPHLYEKHEGDMEAINKELITNDEIVLVDRQPTISVNSIIALRPRIASCYKFGTFDDGALSHHKQAQNTFANDVLGIRTLGVNPIIMGGLAGDFDGDTLLVIPIYDTNNKKLAEEMLASKNYTNPANGEIQNKCPSEISFVA